MTNMPDQDEPHSPITLIVCGADREPCDHDFQGWHDFEDGNGGEQRCAKCGIGTLAFTLSRDW